MPMVPLSIVLAAPMILVGVWLAADSEGRRRAPWLIAFLWIFAAHLTLIGTRYGYEVAWLIRLQPISGALVPPLAWLVFRNPNPGLATSVHLFGPVTLAFVAFACVDWIDVGLAVITFFYAGLLLRLGAKGDDGLPWAPVRQGPALLTGLWTVIAILVLSGATDVVVVVDVLTTGGAHLETIAGRATIVGALIFVPSLWLALNRRTPASAPVTIEPSWTGSTSCLGGTTCTAIPISA